MTDTGTGRSAACTAPDLACAVLRDQLHAFEVQLPAVRNGTDPESLHDLRVALRRSRTVLAELRNALAQDDAAALRAELTWLARLTGPVRDMDVYLDQLPAYAPGLEPGLRSALGPLRDFALKRRELVRRDLERALDSPRAAALQERWRRLAAGEDGGAGPAARAGDASSIAGRSIARRYHRLMERRDGLAQGVTPERLHALRKSGKKLRYVLEIFRGVLPSVESGKLIGRLRRLQDALGRHHDLHVHADLTLQLAEKLAAAGHGAPRGLLAAGGVVQIVRAEERRCARECLDALDRMARPKVRRQVGRLRRAGAGPDG